MRAVPLPSLVVRATFVALAAPLALQAQAPRAPSALESTVDTAIRPGNDFFAYANGAWLTGTALPPGKPRWGPREEISEFTRQRVARLIDEARTAPTGTTPRKVADYRAAWLDGAEIERRGRTPVQAQLDSINLVVDRASLTRALARRMRADVDPLNWGIYQSSALLGLAVEGSIHGEKNYSAFLVQGGLALGDRDAYLGGEPKQLSLRAMYRDYITSLMDFGGFDHAAQRADAVLALETAIARTHATRERSANDRNADTVWTRADLARRAPGIDWPAFLSAAGLARQDAFVIWQPSAVVGAAMLVESQPLEAWKDYLRFHVIADHAELLPRAIADRALGLRSVASGMSSPPARAQRAMDATQAAMSEAIGRMYAERFFPEDQRERVQRIVAEVRTAFIKRVEGATWMTPATRTVALAKLKKLYIGIGYPEHWQGYDALAVDPTDAMGNVRRVEEREYRRALAKIGRPMDQKEWWLAPQTPGALLVFQQNAYTFAAALLQPPKFDPAASEAATFGAIGAIIGHDITHYVDVLGAEYGVDGAMRRWWTAEDSAHYQALSEPLVQQFNAYHPFPDTAVDGRLTLRENIADLAGLAAAFDAYRHTLGRRAADKDYVRQCDREFFIAFVQAWRVRMSDDALRVQLTNDHAPEMYRFSTVRNLDAWYDAFDVRPGDRLYLPPAARVRIW